MRRNNTFHMMMDTNLNLQCHKLGTLATDLGSEMPIHMAHVISK